MRVCFMLNRFSRKGYLCTIIICLFIFSCSSGGGGGGGGAGGEAPAAYAERRKARDFGFRVWGLGLRFRVFVPAISFGRTRASALVNGGGAREVNVVDANGFLFPL